MYMYLFKTMKVENEVKVYFIFTFSSLSTIIMSYRLKLQTVKIELKVESDNKLDYVTIGIFILLALYLHVRQLCIIA